MRRLCSRSSRPLSNDGASIRTEAPASKSLGLGAFYPFRDLLSWALRSKRCLTRCINRRSVTRSNIGRSTSHPARERSSAPNTSWANQRRTSASCRHGMKTTADRRGRRFKKSSVSGIDPCQLSYFTDAMLIRGLCRDQYDPPLPART
jgi:hypothetical protein